MEIEVSKRNKSVRESKEKPIELETLLKDKDVAEFYQFVHEHGLREKAIAVLEQRIQNLEKLKTKKFD